MRYFELSWKLIFWCIHHSVMHLISITLAEETRSALQTCNPESLTLGRGDSIEMLSLCVLLPE